jgi:hypothetical protein
VGHSKALAALALALVCAIGSGGCAYMPESLERPFRKPGTRLVDFPEQVSAEYDCGNQKMPWFKLEKLEVWPKRIEAGQDLGQRLVYSLCAANPTAVVTGKLERRIIYRGEAVLRDTDAKYELRAGRWVVDVVVTVPATAPEGLYALELEFKGGGVKFTGSETFAVEAAAAK